MIGVDLEGPPSLPVGQQGSVRAGHIQPLRLGGSVPSWGPDLSGLT
jgi:hypothetical protein